MLLLGVADALAQPAKTPRIAFLYQTAGACKPDSRIEAFEGGLRDLGYIPGGTIIIDLVQDDPYALVGRTQIAALALKHRLPAIGGTIEIAEAGLLVVYGPNRLDLFRRAAGFVDKLLKGAKPATLPFEQPSKFELVVNLKTAAALGITVPPALVLRADRTIH
ncbi:MAG TPA: ABC transporter substrate binding protein [Burkholderiales bacterium]|nr:ABC transporter substrate binding protein [Burkholderiales bacterium]